MKHILNEMTLRKAEEADLAAVTVIYEAIHEVEAQNGPVVCWERGVYPTAETAAAALERGELYVCTQQGKVLAAAILNQIQDACYAAAPWQLQVPPEQVLVMHTLAVHPAAAGRGIGKAFAAFYEQLAKERRCAALRMDTNVRNLPARGLYRSCGFQEIGFADCSFHGIPGTQLVLLEKEVH